MRKKMGRLLACLLVLCLLCTPLSALGQDIPEDPVAQTETRPETEVGTETEEPEPAADESEDSIRDAVDMPEREMETTLPDDAGTGAEPVQTADIAPQSVPVVTVGPGAETATHAQTLQGALAKVADGGTIVLKSDYVLGEQLHITKSVAIRSEASSTKYTISQTSGAVYLDMITISAGATLTLEQITLDGSANNKSRFFWVRGESRLVLGDGATLQNKKALILDCRDGAAIWNDGTVDILTGSLITNCEADYWGGAIYNKQGATLNLSGGIIQNCKAFISGGAIYNSGIVYMTGGAIRNCTVRDDGGGVTTWGDFYLSGGTIAGCITTGRNTLGGGIYHVTGNLYVSGGTITECVADNGSAIYDAAGIDRYGTTGVFFVALPK